MLVMALNVIQIMTLLCTQFIMFYRTIGICMVVIFTSQSTNYQFLLLIILLEAQKVLRGDGVLGVLYS